MSSKSFNMNPTNMIRITKIYDKFITLFIDTAYGSYECIIKIPVNNMSLSELYDMIDATNTSLYNCEVVIKVIPDDNVYIHYPIKYKKMPEQHIIQKPYQDIDEPIMYNLKIDQEITIRKPNISASWFRYNIISGPNIKFIMKDNVRSVIVNEIPMTDIWLQPPITIRHENKLTECIIITINGYM